MTLQSRSEWMGLLARSGIEALRDAWGALNLSPEFEWLRAPETGAVMVRGRAGGSGKPFNLGEMTVTRCALRLLDDGVIGHAYVQGRDRSHAERAALADALLQTRHAEVVQRIVIAPLAEQLAAARAEQQDKAAATRVDFFTLVRGEDQP